MPRPHNPAPFVPPALAATADRMSLTDYGRSLPGWDPHAPGAAAEAIHHALAAGATLLQGRWGALPLSAAGARRLEAWNPGAVWVAPRVRLR